MGNIFGNIRAKKQDKQTQKLYDNVTKSLQAQAEAQENATTSYPLNDVPLQEEHPIGSLLLLRGAGPALAQGLEFAGKLMPSTGIKIASPLIQKASPYVSKVSPTIGKIMSNPEVVAPYADAALLSY